MSTERKNLEYSIHRSARAKRISVTVHHTGEVIVTVPKRSSEFLAHIFIRRRSAWITATQEKLKKKFENKIILNQSQKDFNDNKKKALEFIKTRVEHFNTFYGFTVGEIRVRNQKSRWGSCARNGNLSFNYGLIKVPQELADYVVVHELCHLKEFNHSKHFWDLVAKVMPDYKTRRKALKKNYISIT